MLRRLSATLLSVSLACLAAADDTAPANPSMLPIRPKPDPATIVIKLPRMPVKLDADPDVARRQQTPYPVDDEAWLNNPFPVLAGEMDDAASDLAGGKTRPPARATQPRIITRLDQVIATLEQKCNGSGSGNSNNPRQGAEKSILRKTGERNGELRATDPEGRRWAKLSPKDRKRVLQSQTEGFPPGFDDVLADYFRRVSKADEPASTPASTRDDPAESASTQQR